MQADIKQGALLELGKGLDVCKEGVALNIAACAKTLRTSLEGNPLKGLYSAARDTLINQHLLQAVRLSHKNQQNKVQTSLEIHEVQALRNALADKLGLEEVSDRHISQNYQKVVGAIANDAIPSLITTHAVASRVADELLNHLRATGLVKGDWADAKVNVEGEAYQVLCASLKQDLGIDPNLLLEADDNDYSHMKVATQAELAERLVQWINSENKQVGSAVHGLGETTHSPVSEKQIELAMDKFWNAERLVSPPTKPISWAGHFLPLKASLTVQQTSDEKKRKEQIKPH